MKTCKGVIGVFSSSYPITAEAPEAAARAAAYLQSRGWQVKLGELAGKRDFYRSGTIRERAALPKGAELQSVYVYNYASEQPRNGMSLDENDLVYGAILRDLEEGNIPGCNLLREDSGRYADLHVELEYRLWKSQESAYEYGYKDVPIYPSMTNTLRALMGLDYVSEAQLALWDEELEKEEALLAEEGGIPAASVARP